MEERYYDNDGTEISLYKLVSNEPQWAVSRIKQGEAAEDKVKVLQQKNERLKRQIEKLQNAIRTAVDLAWMEDGEP